MTDCNQINQVNQVSPGTCPPEGCPPPTEIVCIDVDKVYDSCFQVDDRTRSTIITRGPGNEWPTGPFVIGDTVPCALTTGQEISCSEISRVDAGEGFVTVTIMVTVPVTLTNPNAADETVQRNFNFTKIVTLCCPEGVEPDCSDSTLLGCSCVITAIDGAANTLEVTCDFQVCLVIKCVLTVELLVPSYGFCVPAPCSAIGGICPPMPPSQCF